LLPSQEAHRSMELIQFLKASIKLRKNNLVFYMPSVYISFDVFTMVIVKIADFSVVTMSCNLKEDGSSTFL
jgi:hypothetical protein